MEDRIRKDYMNLVSWRWVCTQMTGRWVSVTEKEAKDAFVVKTVCLLLHSPPHILFLSLCTCTSLVFLTIFLEEVQDSLCFIPTSYTSFWDITKKRLRMKKQQQRNKTEKVEWKTSVKNFARCKEEREWRGTEKQNISLSQTQKYIRETRFFSFLSYPFIHFKWFLENILSGRRDSFPSFAPLPVPDVVVIIFDHLMDD